MAQSVYLHIPFCKSKCHYCSFVSYNKLGLKKEYLKALETEIKTYYQNEPLKTVYFGGGTPSNLCSSEFSNILKLFNITEETEITTELNPDDLNYKYLKDLLDIGINRISIGCQTFNDEILKLINRRHDSTSVIKSVENAQKAGFENISLDFIYGLPNQTEKMFYDDLKKGIDLGIKHISLYGLTIEEDCYFSQNPPQNLADDDMQADMYLGAIELLKSNGLEHYEISNFSYPGYNSKHNLNYWDNSEYYGFGTASVGYIGKTRYSHTNSIENYIKAPTQREKEHIVSFQEQLEEEIFLGFRKLKGISTYKINKKFNIDFENKYKDILLKYSKFIKKEDEYYKLTGEGILISNTILSEFIE